MRVLSDIQFELNMERAAHRETRAYLARALQAAQYYQARARDLEGSQPPAEGGLLPSELPIPTQDHARAGAGDDVVVVVCELIEAAAKLAGQLALEQGGDPASPKAVTLIGPVQTQLARLARLLTPPQGEGGAPHTGGPDRVPPYPTR